MNEVISNLIKYKTDNKLNGKELHRKLFAYDDTFLTDYNTMMNWLNGKQTPLQGTIITLERFLDSEYIKYSNGGGI